MKKILVIIILFAFANVNAQIFKRENGVPNDANNGKGDIDNYFLSWGYYLGFNSMDFKFDYNGLNFNGTTDDVIVKSITGFNVGLIGDMKINNHLNLRFEPGIFFGSRTLFFPGFTEQYDIERETKSTYVHLPLLLKMSTKRLNNFKPFIVAGVSTSMNLSSNEDNPDDNTAGQFRMYSSIYSFEAGFGVDFYLPYFKFSPSIRGVFTGSNELVPDESATSPWTQNIHSMKTRGIFINFTVQ